jgi:hypothetical protein
MVQALCTSGNHEALKCSVHGAATVLAAAMAAYNIAACSFRRDVHLRVNAIIYTLAVAWEVKQTLHHLRYPSDPGGKVDIDSVRSSVECA